MTQIQCVMVPKDLAGQRHVEREENPSMIPRRFFGVIKSLTFPWKYKGLANHLFASEKRG